MRTTGKRTPSLVTAHQSPSTRPCARALCSRRKARCLASSSSHTAAKKARLSVLLHNLIAYLPTSTSDSDKRFQRILQHLLRLRRALQVGGGAVGRGWEGTQQHIACRASESLHAEIIGRSMEFHRHAHWRPSQRSRLCNFWRIMLLPLGTHYVCRSSWRPRWLNS
ncbi:hypothetical protein T492DRAFT_286525 [Pavlovales sp. CCMP2436]|nr:hypothetical protein T492DRAFT_286525 [Pavlovales sp. CCMP2436]